MMIPSKMLMLWRRDGGTICVDMNAAIQDPLRSPGAICRIDASPSTNSTAHLGEHLVDSSACSGIKVPMSTGASGAVRAYNWVDMIIRIKPLCRDNGNLSHFEYVGRDMNSKVDR